MVRRGLSLPVGPELRGLLSDRLDPLYRVAPVVQVLRRGQGDQVDPLCLQDRGNRWSQEVLVYLFLLSVRPHPQVQEVRELQPGLGVQEIQRRLSVQVLQALPSLRADRLVQEVQQIQQHR